VLTIVIITAFAAIAAHTWNRTPVSARVDRDVLIAVDDAGRETWRKAFPYALQESIHTEIAAKYTWVGDLDGDGHNEVLFAPHPAAGGTESTPLICYDERGRERWRYQNSRRVRTAAEAFAPTYSVAQFLAVPLGKGKAKAVLIATTHAVYYPSQVALLSRDGRILREYWHSGHLNHIQAADLNGDGRTEYYLGGINNGRHAATVVVLDEDHFAGASDETQTPRHQLLDFSHGVERARILVPGTCLNKRFDPYNPIATFSVGNGEIVVQTAEVIGPGAGVFHHISPDFRLLRTVISDSYSIEYRRAVLAHQVADSSCSPDDVPDIEILRDSSD
jgi:hypothetical protein